MDIAIIIGVACAIIGAMAIVFRSNAVYMFLALCAGSVLAELVAQDLTQVLNSFIDVKFPVYSYVQIFLLLIFPIILLFMYRKSAGASLPIQIIPAVAFVILAFMFITTMLPYDMQKQIQDSNIYTLSKPYFGITVAVGMLASLFYFWTKKPHHEKHGKKHKK